MLPAMSDANKQWKLKARPTGIVGREHFDFVTGQVPEPKPGEAVVRVQYVSLDPAMRGWMNDVRSYVPPVGLGQVMRAGGVGRVVASNDPALAVGDWVSGMTGVQQFAAQPARHWTQIDPLLAPPERWLGVLGMPGMTAYFGLFDVGEPRAGETLVVSAASGAVGAVVGQLGKIAGLRVVGIAGGTEKCRYIKGELGFDGAIDYKHENIGASLRELTPDGIDIYFDNVGGEILDAALTHLARRARVVVCGAVSQYNAPGFSGPKNYMMLLVQGARMEGFTVLQFTNRYAEATRALGRWLASGKLKAREDVVEGIETFPETLQKLYRGENFGKLILKV
jgi:NADPH-dependent curcumin reductase CurA